MVAKHNSIWHYQDCQKVTRLLLLFAVILSFGFSAERGWTSEGLFINDGISSISHDQPQKAQPDPTMIRSRIVKVNFDRLNKSLLIKPAESISLNLFDDVFYIAQIDRVEWKSRSRFSWFGHIEGAENSHVLLVIEDGAMAGNITLQGEIYHIRFVGDETHIIREIDQSGFPDEALPIRVQLPLPSDDSPLKDVEQDSCDTIDVLVVYTGAALTGAGGTTAMNTLIQLAIDETNQSYINSNITQRVRLVHSEQVSYTETGNLCDGTANSDLYRLRSASDGHMDNVHALRNNYGADIVVLLVENGGGYCGCAYMQNTVSSSFESFAFAVVDKDCATGYYSFGHEMGHVMGAGHDWYVDSSTTPYAYSHGYVYKPSRWRTVMAYNNECYDSGYNCTRIQYWSNPLVNYGGVATGIGEGNYHAADNRKTLNNTACTVANFRQQVSSETISIPTNLTGPTTGIINNSYSFSTGGSTSSLGHTIEYQFDLKGDGSDLSLWGPPVRLESWTVAGAYNVKSRARCVTDTSVVSSWSSGLSVSIYDFGIYVGQNGVCGGKSLCVTSMQDGMHSAQSFTIVEITYETYNENFILNEPKVLIFEGGWDTDFTSNSSYTTINGSITITNGTMIIENIILQ